MAGWKIAPALAAGCTIVLKVGWRVALIVCLLVEEAGCGGLLHMTRANIDG